MAPKIVSITWGHTPLFFSKVYGVPSPDMRQRNPPLPSLCRRKDYLRKTGAHPKSLCPIPGRDLHDKSWARHPEPPSRPCCDPVSRQPVQYRHPKLFPANIPCNIYWYRMLLPARTSAAKFSKPRSFSAWGYFPPKKRRKPRKSGLRRHFLAPPARIELTTNP